MSSVHVSHESQHDTRPGNQRCGNQKEPIIQEPLALPAPSGAESEKKLDLSQEQIAALKFDALGPMVVNSDRTLSRITNWDKMVPLERERTMRVLNARNRLRLDEQQKETTSSPDESVSLAAPGV